MRHALPGVMLTVTLLAAAYTTIAKTPLKSAIGRRAPAVASMFSPGLFNFTEQYTDGRVLEFEVGMTAEDVLTTLRRQYVGRGRLVPGCLIRSVESFVGITPYLLLTPGLRSADRLCVFADQRLMLIFTMDRERVSAIEVSYVRNEES